MARNTKWTEKRIIQSFDLYIQKNGRVPLFNEIFKVSRKELPLPSSIKKNMGLTLIEFYKKYYNSYINRCQARSFNNMEMEYWVEDFKQQYINLGTPIESTYNKLRRKGTPNTQTLRKISNIDTWNNFLKYCGLCKIEPPRKELTVIIDFDYDDYDSLVRLADKLKIIEEKYLNKP